MYFIIHGISNRSFLIFRFYENANDDMLPVLYRRRFCKISALFSFALIVINIFSIPFLVVLNLKFPGGFANAHIHVNMSPFV
jgi:hypothetical protein